MYFDDVNTDNILLMKHVALERLSGIWCLSTRTIYTYIKVYRDYQHLSLKCIDVTLLYCPEEGSWFAIYVDVVYVDECARTSV